MASLNFIKIMLIILLFITSCKTSLSSQSDNDLPTISAEPAILPFPPLPSPASAPVVADSGLTPDIFPQFPTPAFGSPPPPSKSSLPIIPSSPSPPDPESLASPHPQFSISPTGSMPESSAFAPKLSKMTMVIMIFIAVLVNEA
uniref:Uncharacterized protein n=1 Tax=Opuntia streptacantha TaxID=393608 RepID=A0A7C9E4D9_OPUST